MYAKKYALSPVTQSFAPPFFFVISSICLACSYLSSINADVVDGTRVRGALAQVVVGWLVTARSLVRSRLLLAECRGVPEQESTL